MQTVRSYPQQRPVVVGIDRAPEHLSVVDLAVAQATLRGAPLTIVHVWPSRYRGTTQGRTVLSTEVDSRHLLELAARRAHHQAPGLSVTIELLSGRASAVLAERSATARLLVVGHRDGAPGQSNWGSTATYLAHQSACPLLVRRGPTPQRGPVVLAASGDPRSVSTVACAYEEAARYGSHLVALHVSSPAPEPATPAATGGAVADRARSDRHLAEALAGWTWTFPDVVVERLVVPETEVGYTLQRAARRSRGRDGAHRSFRRAGLQRARGSGHARYGLPGAAGPAGLAGLPDTGADPDGARAASVSPGLAAACRGTSPIWAVVGAPCRPGRRPPWPAVVSRPRDDPVGAGQRRAGS